MSDRGIFWPAPPDWTSARIEAPSVTITARHGGSGLWLLSGDIGQINARISTMGEAEAVLPLAPDRVLLVMKANAGLSEGWHAGVAISDISQAFVQNDILGPRAKSVLAQGSPSLALNSNPRSASVGFAGLTVILQPLTDGARLHVDHSQANYLWHWLATACQTAKDQI